MNDIGEVVMQRIEALGAISDEPDRLIREFCSPAMRRANELVGSWMKTAGMTVRQDAIGNLIGHFPGTKPEAKTLLFGSHLDTVRNAGKFDGPLGVLVALACVEQLHCDNCHLPFAIDVIGFSDEEGMRYQSISLGSRAVAGIFDERDLQRRDANGVSMADAIRQFGGDPANLRSAKISAENLIGYVEVHIEQGPMLEKNNHAIGTVSGIAGKSRFKVSFAGRAGHAGATPMRLRHDALCAASEFILGVEHHARRKHGLVATVGQISAHPNAGNVIPEQVILSLDVRHHEDDTRLLACENLRAVATQIATKRNLAVTWQQIQEKPAVPCSRKLSRLLKQTAKKHQPRVLDLPSGAGHDAAIMAKITEAAMLFVRCKDGLTHHPDESVSVDDIRIAIAVMNDFLRSLASDYERL